MKLFTKEIVAKLRKNSRERVLAGLIDMDHKPVVKLFTPNASCTWLLVDMDEDGRCFGLCDFGFGAPELGYVMREELERLTLGLTAVERDLHFKADKTIGEYAHAARRIGYIEA